MSNSLRVMQTLFRESRRNVLMIPNQLTLSSDFLLVCSFLQLASTPELTYELMMLSPEFLSTLIRFDVNVFELVPDRRSLEVGRCVLGLHLGVHLPNTNKNM
jgi:hypothetical protein